MVKTNQAKKKKKPKKQNKKLATRRNPAYINESIQQS